LANDEPQAFHPSYLRGMRKTVNLFLCSCLFTISFLVTTQHAVAQEKELVVFESADSMPHYKDGEAALKKDIQTNLVYPKLAIAQGISGEVLVTFVVDEYGGLTEFEIVKEIDLECDIAAIKAIHSTAGKWISGIKDGRNVNVYATARVKFDLPKAKTAVSYAAIPPKYKDGEEALFKLVQSNVVYPPKAIEQGLQGKVFVKFIVDSKGHLSDFEILQGVGTECNKEAIRAILLTDGDWIPASHEGKNVNAYVTLPVQYKVLRVE
jgi:TonB family protein